MHLPPNPTNPAQVLSHAERLAREQQGTRMGLVFQAVTSICLGVMTAKMVLDEVRAARDPDRERGRTGHRHR